MTHDNERISVVTEPQETICVVFLTLEFRKFSHTNIQLVNDNHVTNITHTYINNTHTHTCAADAIITTKIRFHLKI